MYEFAIAAALLAGLAAALVSRVVVYQEQAEQAKVQQTVATLRAALQMKAGHALIAHREQELQKITTENPLGWLVEKPQNYLGEYYAPDPKELPYGNWYYDRGSKTLVYLLNAGINFAPRTSNLLKFKVRLLRFSKSAAEASGSNDRIRGVVLDQVSD